MKKLFTKMLPLSMAGVMLLGSIVPTFATVSDTHTVTSNGSQQTEVTYNQESSFEVTVPKLIDLGSDKLTNYTVGVTGDISSDEVIKVVPDESFLMKDISGATNLKDDVTATVTQDKTEWIFNEFETNGNGTVSAPDLTAGTWEGKFNFNIKLEALSEEAVTLEAGLYDAEGNMLCTWEESGIDVEINYSDSTYYGDYYKDTITSGYYVLTNNYPNATNIIIPEGVTIIGNCVFRNCTNLQKVVIPEGVTIIGGGAFDNCTSLTDVKIPKSVTNIYGNAFRSCSNAFVGELNLSNVNNMGSEAFGHCKKIESIILSDNLTNLCTTGPTFNSCSNLSEVIYKGETYTNYTLLNTVLKENGVTFSSSSTGNPFDGTALTE